jgi:hypothetical protein
VFENKEHLELRETKSQKFGENTEFGAPSILQFESYVFRKINSKRIRLAGHVARTEKYEKYMKSFVQKISRYWTILAARKYLGFVKLII